VPAQYSSFFCKSALRKQKKLYRIPKKRLLAVEFYLHFNKALYISFANRAAVDAAPLISPAQLIQLARQVRGWGAY
jgi:hypothetical protein